VVRACHAGLVTRARFSVIAGVAMIVIGCALPWRTFGEWSAASLPYQDPTPEMVAEQAARVSALEQALLIELSVAVVLASLGVFACSYGFRQRARSVGRGTRTVRDQATDST